MPGIDASPAHGVTGFVIAAVLYAASYLSFVRTLKYPRNWMRVSLVTLLLPIVLIGTLLAYVSVSSAGINVINTVVAAGFTGVLFYVIAAPAMAFKPASRATEFLARHGDYAGVWMLLPAVIAAYTLHDVRLHGLLAAAMTIELAWYLRRRRADQNRRLLPIQGADLAVLNVQASDDLKGFSKQHGISELVLSDDMVAWRGCDKTTSPCPFNFYVNRLGLNTAPCCREHMKEIVHAVNGWLEEIGATYWLEGGTLLGAVRENGELLPWEDDVDVSVLMEDDRAWDALVDGVTACAARDGYFVDVFERSGFIAVSHALPQAAPLRWENYRLRGEVRLDLATYRPAMNRGEPVLMRSSPKGKMPAMEGGGFGVARDVVLPTSTISLLGRSWACPRHAEDYLRVLYGDFKKVEFSYVDAGPAAARSHIHTMSAVHTTLPKP